MKLKVTSLTLTILIFITAVLSAKINDAGTYLKENVKTFKLSNGITVILLNRGYSPTLAFEIAFRVGSVNETYRTAGAAHMLEHMLFKGTDTVGTKDFSKEKIILKKIEAIGETLDKVKILNPGNVRIPELEKDLKKLQKEHGKYVINSPYDMIYTSNGGVGFNASTSKDMTGYYIQLPSSKLKLWAKTESERLRKPVLREYYLERNNVIQERLMRYDSKGTGLLFEKFIATAFQSHPYRHPIIGWRSNIPFLSLKDVRKFYWDNYIPSRMVITIVGKQDIDKTLTVIKKYFGKIESKPEPDGITIAEAPSKGEKRIVLNFKSNPYLVIGWHKPTFPQKDDYTFDVISELLTSGKTSHLYKKLVLKDKIATSISSWNGAPAARYNNLFVMFAKPAKGVSIEKLEKEIYKEINKFKGLVSRKDLKKVMNRMESSQVFGLERNSGIARVLSYYQIVFNDWRYGADYITNLKTVAIEDVKKTVVKYLIKKNRVVAILKDSRKGGNR